MSLLDDLLTSAIKSSYEKNKRKESEPSILGALKDPQFLQDMKRGVLDSVNRGAVASTIGGPVDLATMALRPLGYNVEKPAWGSEWVGDKMQQLGLLGDTRNPMAEAIASVAVPGAFAKVAPKVFQAEQAAIQNAKIAGPLSDGKFATQRGVFGGLNAKTADKAKLSQAEQMLSKGVDPAQVWKETGWGRGPDGKWRFEIPDKQSKIDMGAFDDVRSNPDWNPNADTFPMDGVLDHKKLYKAYPDAADIQTHFLPDSSMKGSSGAYSTAHDRVTLGQGLQKDKAKSFTLHELQHAIQQREGFARGGSPEQFQSVPYADLVKRSSTAQDALIRAREAGGVDPQTGLSAKTLNESIDGLSQQIASWKDPHQQYLSLGGEAEARLVQSRMNLTPEERAAQFPWNADYFKQQTGVGLDDLIHRFDGGEAKSVGFQYPQDAALETARQNGVKMLGLPENNTALDRAKALGFDTDGFHATGADIHQIDPEKIAQSDYGTIGQGFYIDPSKRAGYSNLVAKINQTKAPQNIIPVKYKSDNLYDMTGLLGPNSSEGSKALTANMKASGYDGTFTSLPDGSINEVAVFNPSIVRSRFAAFDPARVNENDLLAGAMPFGLLLDPENRAKLGMQ